MASGTASDVRAWVNEALAGRPMPALAIVIGVDDASVFDVLETRRQGVRCLVLDPDPAAAARLTTRPQFRRWSAEGRVRLLAGPGYSGAEEAWRLFPPDPEDHVIVVTPRAAAMKPAVMEAARLVGRILFGVRANAAARRQFAPRYLRNVLANLGAIAHGVRADAFDGAWRGQPAVVVGAGPSLDAALPSLRRHASRAVILSTDTALRPLLHAGIAPRVVIGADPGDRNARHFLDLPACPDTWLVAESALDPRAAAAFAGRTAWFRVGPHDPWPWAHDAGLDVPVFEMWGSVLTAAWQLAVRAGCDPIVFVGADLAFTHGRPYARGTTYEYDWAYTATLGVGVDEAWRQQIAMHPGVTVPDVHGREAVTSQPLLAFRDWLLTQAARAGRDVVNATGAGILVGTGVRQATLDATLAAARPLPAIVDLPRCVTTSRGIAPVVEAVDRIRAVIDGGSAPAPVATWEAFTGAALDRPAIAAALAAAAADLTGARIAGARYTLVPWAPLEARGLDRARLSTLPEDVARGGVAAPTAASALSQGIVLAHAVVTALADVGPEVPLAEGADPRSAQWPPAVAWPLRLMEAFLPPTTIATRPPYFQSLAGAADTGTRAAPASRLTAAVASRLAQAVATERPAPAAFRWWGASMLGGLVARGRAGGSTGVALTVEWTAPEGTRAERWSADSRAIARALTGAVVATPDVSQILDVWQHGDDALVLRAHGVAAMLTPDVLTDDHRVPRATQLYAHDDGVVLAPLHATTSVRLDRAGRLHPHRTWPAPIVGELPMGEGAVAWSNGTDRWPDTGPGYVMFQTMADAPVVREPLPFRPTSGVFSGGRLYWNLHRTGVASWAPGDASEPRLVDQSFCGVVAEPGGVVLAPVARDASGQVRAERHVSTWRVTHDGEVSPVRLPADGGCAGVAEGPGWTVRLYPEVDRLRFEGPTRTVDVLCPFPVAAAWTGGTLVVCTAAGDVLRFTDVAQALAALG